MKNWLIYPLLLLWLGPVTQILFAQGPGQSPDRDEVALFTDRSMYISGEQIFFSALLKETGQTEESLSEKVLYCELITPDGNRMAGGKFHLDRSLASGCLQIPAECVSGTYYFRAYTKLMRNAGPSSYHYTRLLIINPEKKDVLPSRNEDSIFLKAGDIPDAFPEDPGLLSTDKKSYKKRDKITVFLPGKGMPPDSARLVCLTVARETALNADFVPKTTSVTIDDSSNFYPETRGISLTGHLQDKTHGIRLPGVEVNLSILGEKDFMAMHTDSAGRFFFSLPDISGNRDLFLCSEKVNGLDPVIKIDNDFCPLKINLPSPPFRLTEEEKKVAFDMAVNCQVASFFGKDTNLVSRKEAADKLPFYGKPTDVILIEKYIELPTIEDYFNELSSPVKVRKSHDEKYFRFYSSQAEMVIFDPLILVDFVAVDDVDRILALSPRDISRIELVNAPYIKGQMMYGGIVSFISKENDFAGIDLPSSGTFISFGFYEDCEQPGIIKEKQTGNIPETSNTVYWSPNLGAQGMIEEEISFEAPDTPGIYLILMQGIDRSGKMFRYSARIEIL